MTLMPVFKAMQQKIVSLLKINRFFGKIPLNPSERSMCRFQDIEAYLFSPNVHTIT